LSVVAEDLRLQGPQLGGRVHADLLGQQPPEGLVGAKGFDEAPQGSEGPHLQLHRSFPEGTLGRQRLGGRQGLGHPANRH
jgi:hypothetical protein